MTQSQNLINVQGLISLYRVENFIKKNRRTCMSNPNSRVKIYLGVYLGIQLFYWQIAKNRKKIFHSSILCLMTAGDLLSKKKREIICA